MNTNEGRGAEIERTKGNATFAENTDTIGAPIAIEAPNLQ
jgi:hypothetical protein